MPFLRQSTAQTIRFGPCLDKTDGVTEETALTLAQADMRLSKDGGAFAQKSAAGNATHDSDGWYSTSLSTTDTNTVGELILNVHQPANMLPVWMRWWVLEEAVYDAIYGASAALAMGSVTGAVGSVTGAVGSVTAAVTVGTINANVVTASALATDAVNEIVDQVWDEAQADHVAAGSMGLIASEVADILVDTAEIGAAGAGLTNINLPDQTMNITGNLSGSVGSVTGAVGSVTAAVTIDDASVDAVWDEDIEAAHGTDATAGLLLRALGQNISNETRDANLFDQLRTTRAVIEHQRGAHTHQPIGNIFYVDPVNGATHASGARGGISDPYATIQDCHDNAVTDSNHDLIILLSGAAAGATTHTIAGTTTISKRYTFIRGPGRDFIVTRTGAGDTLAVTADGVELSGFQLATAATGSGNGLQVTDADFLRAHDLWINATQGDGINLLRAENCQVHDCYFTDTGAGGSGEGIHIVGTAGSSNKNAIFKNHFRDCQGDAIKIENGTTNDTNIYNNAIEGSTGWGINIGASSTDAIVHDNRLGNNTSGAITDAGTTTVLINNYDTWDEVQSGHTTAGSMGEVATEIASILADTNELQTDWANGGRLDLILDARAAEATVAALNDISVADILTTQMTEAYAADGVAPTLAQALFMIMQQAGEFAVSSTTITVKKLDGTTTAATFTLDDATNPTSRTRAT